MTTRKKTDPRPHGVPLDELAGMIEAAGLPVSRTGDALAVRRPGAATRIEVHPPPRRAPGVTPVTAVVLVRTALPKDLASLLAEPGTAVTLNGLATLGALTVEDGEVYVGSRLTTYEGEDAWGIHLPLLFFSAVAAADSLLGAVRRMAGGEPGESAASAWGGEDFAQVERILSHRCVCTAGADGLTAEFGLEEDGASAAEGDADTALWQLDAGQPHPDMGGGLLGRLQMPRGLVDEAHLDRAVARLNRLEMTAADPPPHFGAWTRGTLGNNPAYVCFLPNALHRPAGLAVNVSVWGYGRARWAAGVLARA